MENKFNQFSTFELIRELNNRGYFTDLLYSKHSVNDILDAINERRDDDGEEPISIPENKILGILEASINVRLIESLINERIEEEIFDNYE